MIGIVDCCSTALAGMAALPNPALPLLPSFILGTICSALILFFVYSKESRLGMKGTFKLILKNIFCLLPTHGIGEECNNPDCVRCHKYEEVKVQVIERWREIMQKDPKLDLKRVETVVKKLKMKTDPSIKEEAMKKQDSGTQNRNSKTSKKEVKKKSSHLEFQKPTFFHMELPAKPNWSDQPVYQQEIQLLKLNFSVIHMEFQSLFGDLQNGNSFGWKVNELEHGHWCVFPLLDQGRVNEANSHRCPNTAALLGSLPSTMAGCVFGNASFSLLYPDSIISPHHGPTNLRLRCHLGLVVPQGCWLEVGGQQHQWEEGKCLVFDDSFLHSTSFAAPPPGAPQSNPRAVLMVDWWHPDITHSERTALTQLLSPN